jgi:hypothetical protein
VVNAAFIKAINIMIVISILLQLAITIDPVTTIEVIEIFTALVKLVSVSLVTYYSVKQVKSNK